ncbi:MAG: hypothetical protein VX713_03160 [Pseudomonadota bacterium]|nr:hypothetical protein [Pseudomonadota bacterium]|tara:strand:- start:791 stop:1000 length:210 start_codon:yes stop_codon:yes gene_type:complete
MSDNLNSSIDRLFKSTSKLLKRFKEQKGIIDAYIKKERKWKEHKLHKNNEIKKLEKEIKKLKTTKEKNE